MKGGGHLCSIPLPANCLTKKEALIYSLSDKFIHCYHTEERNQLFYYGDISTHTVLFSLTLLLSGTKHVCFPAGVKIKGGLYFIPPSLSFSFPPHGFRILKEFIWHSREYCEQKCRRIKTLPKEFLGVRQREPLQKRMGGLLRWSGRGHPVKRSRAALTEGSLSCTYNRAKAFKTPSAEQGRQRGGTFPSFQRDFFLTFASFF